MISETSNDGSNLLTTSYVYDSNGSLISENDGDVTNYGYDVWGNMVSADGATYAYNAQGLRISKTINGTTDNFVLVGGDVWADAESTYLRGLELISSDDCFYLYNIRGDVIQLLDYNGEVVKTYDYDAYGNELTRDLSDENPFRYCGEYYDTETGLIYLRARYYDPSVGRFTSVDPAKHGTNWYVYCGNNPVIYTDRSGKVAETVFDVISVISSIAEVCINPTDLWAWAGLAGDVVDLIPFATGVGETIRGIKLIVKASDAADAVVDAVRTTNRVVETTDNLVDAVRTADKVADAVDDLSDTAKVAKRTDEIIENGTKAVTEATEDSTSKVLRGSQNPNTQSAAKKGIKAHKEWDYGPTVKKEVTISKGNRVDGIDKDHHLIFELKPNNSKAIARGQKQLERYIKAASEKYGGAWTGVLVTYD